MGAATQAVHRARLAEVARHARSAEAVLPALLVAEIAAAHRNHSAAAIVARHDRSAAGIVVLPARLAVVRSAAARPLADRHPARSVAIPQDRSVVPVIARAAGPPRFDPRKVFDLRIGRVPQFVTGPAVPRRLRSADARVRPKGSVVVRPNAAPERQRSRVRHRVKVDRLTALRS